MIGTGTVERPMHDRRSVGPRAGFVSPLLAALLVVGLAVPGPVAAEDPLASPAPSPSVEATGQPVEPIASPSPAVNPEPTPAATPRATPTRWPGGLDPTGRYIVVVAAGTDVAGVLSRQKSRGVHATRQFRAAVRGFAARLDAGQLAALRSDPGVVAVVPDEIVSVAQTRPTGVSRIGGLVNPIASIDTVDDRVDADIAIVDTGIDASHPDLNVVGGVNCSTSDRAAWRDTHGHGTHVSGIAAARDDPSGVVGVAPGARLWAVKILNDSGFGYLSWYVCGLDWIASQREPGDPARPLIEVANMSVAKRGADDHACGAESDDVLHAAICRLVKAGVTVVAAAGNASERASKWVPASYNEVITVSALADTDGKSGGVGAKRCYSWGGYDQDDTFADFSNYGGDVDLIAPGKCIYSTMPGGTFAYMSGTSMATPHVTGAVALYKESRPLATPSEVKSALRALGTAAWKTSSDPDSTHEPLLDVTRLDRLGTYSLAANAPGPVGGDGGLLAVPVTLVRSPSFLERVTFTAAVPDGWGSSFSATSLFGFAATATTLQLTLPVGTPGGDYRITVRGAAWDRAAETAFNVHVDDEPPLAGAPSADLLAGGRLSTTSTVPVRVSWPPAIDGASSIASYDVTAELNGATTGTWTATGATTTLPVSQGIGDGVTYRLRASDTAGNVSPEAASARTIVRVTEETAGSVRRSASWRTYSSGSASGGSATYSSKAGARLTFAVNPGHRQVGLVGPTGPTRGKARIYLDGLLVRTIDLYAAKSAARVVLFVANVDRARSHVLTVEVAGTAGRPRVDVDALLRLPVFDQTEPASGTPFPP